MSEPEPKPPRPSEPPMTSKPVPKSRKVTGMDLLNQTMSGAKPEDIEKARTQVRVAAAKQVEEAQRSTPPPVSDESSEPTTLNGASEMPPELVKSAEVADKFATGIDKITNVLLILVLKFGRATSMMVGVLGAMVLVLTVSIIAVVNLWSISSDVGDMVLRLETMEKTQKSMIFKQEAIEKSQKATQETVDKTSKKVTEVAESAPVVEEDEKGRKTIRLKTVKKARKGVTVKAPVAQSQPPPPAALPAAAAPPPPAAAPPPRPKPKAAPPKAKKKKKGTSIPLYGY